LQAEVRLLTNRILQGEFFHALCFPLRNHVVERFAVGANTDRCESIAFGVFGPFDVV
jgi:hypothetical protein